MQNILFSSLAGLPKFVVGFIGTLTFRLVTPLIGFANISPLMATELAGGKAYGPLIAGAYGALSIFLLDVLVGKVGVWTIWTTISYAVVGIGGAWFMQRRAASAKNFIIASVVGTLFFDFVTGVMMGPLVFSQPFTEAFFGQIPFTLRHLGGNIFFAAALAPWFYRKIMANPRLELARVFRFA